MKQYADQIFARLERINKDFDSAYSYIIFDKNTDDGTRNCFEDIIDVISTFRDEDIKYSLSVDTDDLRQFLIVKILPNQKETFLNNILLMSLSKDLNLFMYDPP